MPPPLGQYSKLDRVVEAGRGALHEEQRACLAEIIALRCELSTSRPIGVRDRRMSFATSCYWSRRVVCLTSAFWLEEFPQHLSVIFVRSCISFRGSDLLGFP